MNQFEPPELRLQLEAIGQIPRIVELAQQRKKISLVSMLRFLDIPYGVGRRALEVMRGAGIIEPCGGGDAPGWKLRGRVEK